MKALTNAMCWVAVGVSAALLAACAAPPSPPRSLASSSVAIKPPPFSAADMMLTRPSYKEYDAAVTSMRAGQEFVAEQIFRTMTQVYPSLSGPHVNLGLIYLRHHRLQEAQDAFKKALVLKPDLAVAHNALGIIYRREGNFEKAQRAYEASLKADPHLADAHANLGMLYDLYLHDIAKAISHYQRYRELAPSEAKQVDIWLSDLRSRISAAAVPEKKP